MKCLVSARQPTIGCAREADQRGIKTGFGNRLLQRAYASVNAERIGDTPNYYVA
jgi:hypothetical protein